MLCGSQRKGGVTQAEELWKLVWEGDMCDSCFSLMDYHTGSPGCLAAARVVLILGIRPSRPF